MRNNPYHKNLKEQMPLFMQGPSSTSALIVKETQKKILEEDAQKPFSQEYVVTSGGGQVIKFNMIRPPLLTRDMCFFPEDIYNMEMAEVEVTNHLYYTVIEEKKIEGVRHATSEWGLKPVTNISLTDCLKFCNELSTLFNLEPCYKYIDTKYPTKIEGEIPTGFRLPMRQEWMIFARAGTNNKYSGCNDEYFLDQYASFGYRIHTNSSVDPVMRKAPNEWGLYDMSGNVWEQTNDFDEEEEEDYLHVKHIAVGGSKFTDAKYMTIGDFTTSHPDLDVGFRICRSLTTHEGEKKKK